MVRSREGAVKRQPAWGSEGRKVDRAPASRGLRDDVPRCLEGGLHREIGGGSGVDPSTGARVESRLQKSARSIFSALSRFAARRAGGRGVARRGSSSSTKGGFIASGEKGAGSPARERDRERAGASLGRKAEDRADGRRFGFTVAVVPNPTTVPWNLALRVGGPVRRKKHRVDRRAREWSSRASARGATTKRQKPLRQVGLPQPKGAGGRQPTRRRHRATRVLHRA